MANNDIDTRNYSLKKLISIFREIAANHASIYSFGYGDSTYMGANTVKQYPLLWVDYLPSEFGDNFIKYTFRIILSDLIENGESDLLNRRADTAQILWDIRQLLEYQYDLFIEYPGQVIPFQDDTVDKLSGYYTDAVITIYMSYDLCDVPLKEDIDDSLNLLVDFDSVKIVDSDSSRIFYS